MKTDMEQLSAADWIARLSDGEQLSSAERAALTDFLRESPAHIRELIEYTFIQDSLKNLPVEQAQLDAWVAEARSVAGAIPFPGQAANSQQLQDGVTAAAQRAGFMRRLFMTGSLAAVLLLGGLLLHARMGLLSTEFGEQRTLTLPDGSIVSLNTESQMKVDFSASQRSITMLKGEAFFQVATDSKRPFLVNAENLVLRAVGTQFNVKLAEKDTVVSMIDGTVRVSLDKVAAQAASQSAQLILYKGEAARIDRDITDAGIAAISKLISPTVLRAASWTQGRVEFEAMPLAEVLSEFQRYQHFDVEIRDDMTRQLKLTGSFGSYDFESVLAYIATIPDVTVERIGPRTYSIYRS